MKRTMKPRIAHHASQLTTFGLVTIFSLFCTPVPASAGPYEIKASWEDNAKDLAPTGTDFYFRSLTATSGNGLVAVADNLLFRVDDDQPYVTLGIRSDKLSDVPTFYDAASLPDGALLLSTLHPIDEATGKSDDRRGYLARWKIGGEIEAFAMPPFHDAERPWRLPKLANGPDGSVWALVTSDNTTPFNDPHPMLGDPTPEAGIFELNDGRWKEVPLPYVGSPYYVTDFCVVAPGDLWIVGSKLSISDDGTITDRSGFAANRSAGDWALFTVPEPEGDPLAWNVDRLACRPGAPVYAVGHATNDAQAVPRFFFDGTAVVYATDGTRWHQQPTPKVIEESKAVETETRLRIGATAVDAKGRLWVGISQLNGEQGAMYSLDNGKWTHHPLPEVPTVAFYAPSKIVFDADGAGWAISNRRASATGTSSHGLLLGYKSESWKLLGWKWNRLRQRGFGLGGSLR